jgi:hypothetical protein
MVDWLLVAGHSANLFIASGWLPHDEGKVITSGNKSFCSSDFSFGFKIFFKGGIILFLFIWKGGGFFIKGTCSQ